MLRFFRRIRQSLFKEKKFARYLMYAVGEVVLVIIGIMIAVSLNNLNEAKKQDKKIEAILKQIQAELIETIEDSNNLIEYFRQKDSLIYLAMNNKVTREDYKDPNNYALRSIYTGYGQLKLQEDGFNNLMQKSDVMPDKYLPLINGLRQLYINSNDGVTVFNKKLSLLVDDVQAQLRNNYDWYAAWAFSGKLSDEMIDYFVNDIVHKNNLERYSDIAVGNLADIIMDIRIDAIKSIREIDVLLKQNNSYSFDVNENDYTDWIGTYRIPGDSIEVFIEEKKVKWVSEGQTLEIYPLSATKFQVIIDIFCQFEKDENGQINGLRFHKGSTNVRYEKVIENN